MTSKETVKNKQPLTYTLQDSNSVRIDFEPKLSASLRNNYDEEKGQLIIADLGAGDLKGFIVYVDSEGNLYCVLHKINSHLTEIPPENVSGKTPSFQQKKSTSRNQTCIRASDKRGISRNYACGTRAATMGALLQTEQSKTVQADIRLMGALTGLGITEGTIRLGLQLPFANAKQFEAQSSDIQGLIRGGIFWEVNGKSCRVNLRESPGEVSGEPSHYALMVAPEDYFSEKLVRVLQNDEKGRPYPDWSGMSRLIIGLGFQTTNITAIDQEDLFDPLLSRSIDFGMNVLYRDIADNLNEDLSNFVNFSNPEFIEKVNYVMGLNPLDVKVDFNRRLRIPGVAQQQTLEQFRSFCEARKNSFFSSLLTKLGFGKDNKKIVQAEVDIARLFASTGRFMVVGGGAYAFGEMLLESLDNYEGFISPVPDIASALGMGLAVLMGELDL